MNMESEQTGMPLSPSGSFSRDPKDQASNLPKAIREIDDYLSHTFDEMSVIDETYGKVSSFFASLAKNSVGDADYDQLSKNEQQEALLYMAAAIAVKGASAVIKGIKEAVAIEKVKRLHRKVAEARIDSLPRQIQRLQRLHDEAAVMLMRHNGHPFRASEVKQSFAGIADILEKELCQYRDIRFRLDMLCWLKDEYEAWLEGRLFSDTPMPVVGQATIAAIYLLRNNSQRIEPSTPPEIVSQIVASAQPPVSAANMREGIRKVGQTLAESLDLTRYPNGKDFLSALEILAIVDSQMAAVLEYFNLDEDPLASAKVEEEDDEDNDEDMYDPDKLQYNALYANLYMRAGSSDLPHLKNNMEKNPVTLDSMKVLDAFYTMKGQYDKADNWVGINSLMVMAAGIIPVWTLGWKWYWALLLSVVIVMLVYKVFLSPNMRSLTDNILNKLTMMDCNYNHILTQRAALIAPESKLKQMLRSRNHIFIGIILGGIIGMVAGPVGAVIGAIIGGFLGSGSSEEADDHGEGWEEMKIYSPVKQGIVSVIVGAILVLEIIALFVD